MATVAGTVQNISGKFFAKDGNGNVRELSQGDKVYENDTVFGDKSNTTSQKIEVAVQNSDAVNLNANQAQTFDSSMIETAFGEEELYFPEKSVTHALRDGSMTDVVSDLRDAEFKNEKPTAIDEEGKDVTEEETAEGDEEVEDETEGSGNFQARDGDATDIASDLRNAAFKVKTQVFEDKEAFKSESEDRLGSSYEGTKYTNPFTPTSVTPPSTFTPPPVTPPTTVTPPPPPPPVTPPEAPRTIIAIFAAQLDGTPLKDGSGNYIGVNEAPEGGNTYYVALAFKPGTTVFNDTSKLTTQNGTVDFTFTDGTATTSDYTPQAGLTTILLGTAVSANALDDNIADNGEKFTVTIKNFTPDTTSTYGAVTINGSGVTTTITDNSKPLNSTTPHNPNDTPNHTTEGNKEIVMIKLFAADENGNVIKDGTGNYQLANSTDEIVGSKAKYIAYAFENGQTIFNDTTKLTAQVGQVTVEFTNGTATGVESSTSTEQNGTADYNKTGKTIQIGTVFSTEVFKDTTSDLGETFTVKLVNNTYASYSGKSYESVVTNTDPVTTTIKERLFAKIEVLAGDKDETNEGAPLQYTITIVDENGTPVTLLNGGSNATVHLKYEGLSTNPATKTTDYTAQDTVTVLNNTNKTVFTLPAIDDYFAEGDEQLRITITEIEYNNNSFSIKPHTTANGANADKIVVDGTIKDNPAAVEQPVGGTGEDVPGGTPTYGPEDTVYVKITNNSTAIEGNNLTHTVTLVNSAGAVVVVPTGEKITVTITYLPDATLDVDFKDNTPKTTTVEILGGTSSTVITHNTKDDFTADDNEVYTATLTNVSQTKNTYENIAIGDSAGNNKSVTGTITDGVTLGVPTNATVDEDNFDIQNSVVTITDTKSLNIVSPNLDNAYKLLFANSVVATDPDTSGILVLKSNTQAITFNYATEGKIIATRTDGKKVFEIELKKFAAGGTDDKYTYTQFENIDHPDANADDNVVLTFGYYITDQGETSSVQNFTVTVNDSLPSGIAQNITLNEDGSQIIYISDESFAGGKITLNDGVNGNQEILKDGTINIYDTAKDDIVGTLKNNGDGTLTFTPKADYSGPTAGFSYQVSDGDGDTANASITITVTPVADAPTLADKTVTTWEDANTTDLTKTDGNIREGGNVKVLGLAIPVKKDQIDKNDNNVTDDSGTTPGDNPERLGAIEFSFATSGDFGTATIGYDTNGDGTLDGTLTTITKASEFTIIIVDPSIPNYHVNGQIGDYSLTKAQYESIAIMHDQDNATNIKTKIEVASHEVQEDGTLYTTDIVSTKASQIITLDIKAVTDDITALEFSAGNAKTHTVTMAATEGNATIDIATLLKNQVLGDNDGSEKRWYEISATSAEKKLPEGTIITIGGSKGTVGADGTVSITFPDNKVPNPTFTIEFPEQFGKLGLDFDVTITLKVQDKDSDSTVTPDIKTDSVNLKITGDITPVADIATIQVAQAVGFEDAGRDGGNTTAKNGAITDATKGIPLDIKVTSDDKDGSETFNVTIKDIPNGGALYVYDKSLNSGAGDWVLVNETFTSTSTVILTTNGTKFNVEIKDFQNGNDKAPKFIPPHNDDTDYTLKVSSVTKDGASLSAATEKDIFVVVKNIADAPVGTDLKAVITVNEDSQLNLKDIYTTPATLASYDSPEELTVKIELTTGFSIHTGSPYYIENGMYVVKASDINAGNIKLNVPENFSGNASFKLTYVTTEKAGEGDSKTWNTQTVSIFVNPIADNITVAASSTIYEDADGSANKIDLTPTKTDTDGSETVTGVKILANVPAGYELFLGSANGTSIASKLIGGYYVLTLAEAGNVYAKNTTPHAVSGNFDLTVVYTVKDTKGAVTDTQDFTHTHTVNVKAVTDAPTLTLGTITQESGSVTISGSNVTIVDENSEFKVPVTTTSSDTDSSEAVTKIVISGVPMGVEVVGGTYYGYSGSVHNGIWEILAPADNTLDTNGALSNITFKVTTGADFAARDIKITTYTQDGAGADVKNDSKTIHIDKSYISSGPGTGNPPLFDLSTKVATIYEDNNDGTSAVIYNLGKSIDVANSGGSASGNYAITITDFPTGTTVAGASYSYVEGGKTYYVITGTGNAADVVTKLSTIIVTPPTDMNTGGDKNGQMTFSATISTFDGGTFKSGTGIPSYTETIIPVTDAMTVAVTADNINEDGTSNLSITLSNPNDGTKTELVGNSLTITVTETWADVATGGGTNGTLTDSSGKYNIVNNGGGIYTITPILPADNFTVATPITGLQYTPASNRDGSVKFDVSVQNKEGTSVTLDSTGNKTITVTPVVDVVLNASVVTATGIEDTAVTVGATTLANPVKLEITAGTFADGSEKIGNIILDEVPNGFTVWYNDGTNLVMATNIGTTTGAAFDLTPNITGDANAARNKWLVPTTGGVMPDIYINAPTNWSGDFGFKAKFSITEQNLSTVTPMTVDVLGKITPVADAITIDPTLTFGKVFGWVDLKLNANMVDVDGSETMSLKITGLDDMAKFQLANGAAVDATYNTGTSTWEVKGVTYDQINNIQFAHDKPVASVGVIANTVEIGNTTEGATASGNFELKLSDVAGSFKLDKGMSLDFDKIGDIATNVTTLKGINNIDLKEAGENKLQNLTLQDVLDMSGPSKEIKITGLGEDKVSFKNTGTDTWTKGAAVDGFDIYTNAGDTSVKVKVEQAIVDTII